MSSSIEPTPLEPTPPAPPTGPRGRILLAWLTILVVAGGMIYVQNSRRVGVAAQGREASSLVMLEVQMRWLVGYGPLLGEFVKDDKGREDLRESVIRQVHGFNRGGIDQRLSAIITIGEVDSFANAKIAVDQLENLVAEHQVELTEREARLLKTLNDLYTDYANNRPTAPLVSPADRAYFESSLGWFSELALSPAVPDEPDSARRLVVLAQARRTALGVLILVGIAGVGFAVGIVGLLLIAILAMKGIWKSRLGPPVAHHGVYVEAFSLWLGLYIGLTYVVPRLLGGHLKSPYPESLAMILSLVVLVWPVLRGVSWSQVRADIGLNLGTKPLLEPMLGFLSYLHSLPFLIVGFGFTILLARLFGPVVTANADPFQSDPSMAHPLISQLRNATAADIIPYFVMMCILAPVMEEIAFRGMLYRHLRDLSRTWTFGILFSALAVSLLFAAVHPQGLMATPLLASLACGFVLAREWRGTLIPAIIAHGLNNSLILVFVTMCLL